MMKFGSALVLLVVGLVSTVRTVRIDPPSLVRHGKYFAEDSVPRVTFNDPRCSKGNGLFANLDDCTKYVACKDGSGQDRECPKGFKFDSVKRCTPEKDADCGKSSSQREDIKCPSSYGWFPYTKDCHKFIVCVDGNATLHQCPEGQVYKDNIGCVTGTKCPPVYAQEESKRNSVCKKADGLFTHPTNCLRYYKCVNFHLSEKSCPKGKAFDDAKKSCTREKFNKCKNNDVQTIMRTD